MGFNTIENDGSGGYSLFEDGDNAVAKLSKIECDVSTYQGEFQGYELELRFDAVEEVDEETEGVLPYWPNSKITVADTEQHTSDLAKLLQVAEVTEDVLRELGADDDTVKAILSGDANFKAENVGENQELAQALLKHLAGKVFRVSTKQRTNSDGEPTYSQVDRVLGLKPDKEDRFEGFEVDIELGHPDHEGVSQESESDDSSESDDGDVITGSEDSDDGSDDETEKIFDGEDDEGKE